MSLLLLLNVNGTIEILTTHIGDVTFTFALYERALTDKDAATIYNRLNPDQEPYLQDDEAILDLDNLNG